MKESLSVRFLYGTVPGRIFLKILIDPRISKVFAKYMSSKYSKVIIPWFVKKNGINMTPDRINRLHHEISHYDYSLNENISLKKLDEDYISQKIIQSERRQIAAYNHLQKYI